MKTSFASFWRRNLGFLRLAAISQLEYRINFITDAFIQPLFTAAIEGLLWIAIFKSVDGPTIGGFTKNYYLSYVVWAAFVARLSSSWMYEFRMVTEVETGTINAILARPITFFEYYLSQLMGYKVVTGFLSLLIPLFLGLFWDSPVHLSRVPLALLLALYFLVLVHLMSMCVASMAFFFNRVGSITVAKNLCLWILSGELFPIDIAPSPFKEILLSLPFCGAVYMPVGYITGRFGIDLLLRGFWNVTLGIVFFGLLSMFIWNRGLKKYSGTGA